MPKSEKAIIFGCLHAPFHDRAACDWLIQRIAKEKPEHIAFIGDALEANAASRWPDAQELNLALEDEFKALNLFLADIRKASPKSRRRFLAGNHDNNLLGKGRIDPRVRSLCDWKTTPHIPEWQHWKINPHYVNGRNIGCEWIDEQVCVCHGYETSKPRMDREAFHYTRAHSNSIFVTAHTHRPEHPYPIFWGDTPVGCWRANVGCLRDLKPSYMERKPTYNWGHAYIQVDFMPLKSPRRNREWEAELKIFRMYDDIR